MKKFLFHAFLAVSFCVILQNCADSSQPVSANPGLSSNNLAGTTLLKGGFDEFGYNYNARIFNGPADGVDRILDGKFWGDAVYANDKLIMKWSSDWDRGKAEKWLNPPYLNAWTTNQWNGNVLNGSGDVWHYKIIWVGPLLENSPYWRPGGYAIWGQFETIMDQGSSMNEHFWYAHAKSNGL